MRIYDQGLTFSENLSRSLTDEAKNTASSNPRFFKILEIVSSTRPSQTYEQTMLQVLYMLQNTTEEISTGEIF
jgi:hypothetical protein